MRKVILDTGHRPANAPKHRSVKVPGGARPTVAKTTRQTLHLGEQVVERLGVHCSLSHRDRSSVANEILLSWLTRYGKGREIFDSPASVDLDDRQSDVGPATESEGEAA